MDPERKMEYYYFIIEKQKKIKEQMDKEDSKEETYKFVKEIDIEDGDISGVKTG